MMANKNDLGLRFRVEKSTQPLGLTSLAQAATTDAGLSTCSSISIQVITSNCWGCLSPNSSALLWWYSTCTPLSILCKRAIFNDRVAKSIPVTWAPSRAMLSERIPPPQPTSSTALSCRLPTCSSTQFRRSGLISCNGLNSLSGSHQRVARALNFSISAGSTLIRELLLLLVVIAHSWLANRANRKRPHKVEPLL